MDRINPDYYKTKKGEVIDAIEIITNNASGIRAYVIGNVVKYIARYKNKNGIEDLKKAEWYLTHLIELEEDVDKLKEMQPAVEALERLTNETA